MKTRVPWLWRHWLYGVASLAIWLLTALLLRAVNRTELEWWIRPAGFFASAGFAAWGFPSLPSLAALVLLTVWASNDDFSISAHFYALLWFVVTVGAVGLFRRYRGTAALLMVIGCVGFTVMSGLHAFTIYTRGLALDGFVWSHWTFEYLAHIAAAAMLCLPVGLVLFIRGVRGIHIFR